MCAVLALVSFVVALVLRLASASNGIMWAPDTFALLGLVFLAAAHIAPGWPRRSP